MTVGQEAVAGWAEVATTPWRLADGAFDALPLHLQIPTIDPALARPLLSNLDLWDMWPLQHDDGTIADIAGGRLWFILSAPRLPDPDQRHAIARIRLVHEKEGRWIDCGNALPDECNPGSREWAGSARLDTRSGHVFLYFTAAGHRGDQRDNWAQRLFEVEAALTLTTGVPRLQPLSAPCESLVADDLVYVNVGPDIGEPGFIKGFRDPAWFADPRDDEAYLVFTASLAASSSRWNGAIGVAAASGSGWTALPPLISMDGVNNEPERPHIVLYDGTYYLFFSTQTKMFAPGVAAGPNGLYGFAATSPLGPWEPLNGSGLVAANPANAPWQAYSWWVTPDLVVHGFADLPGVTPGERIDTAPWRRAHFAGVPAPRFSLLLDGLTTRVVTS